MTRVNDITDMSAVQQECCQRFHALTGHRLQGPFKVWLEAPHIIAPALELFYGFRDPLKIELRLFKLMILLVARHWTSHFEWNTHAPLAEKAGLDPDVIEAIRTGRRPVLEDQRLACVHAVVTEMNGTHRVSDPTFQKAEEVLGREELVELMAGMGFFTMIAITLNAFEVSVPANSKVRQLV